MNILNVTITTAVTAVVGPVLQAEPVGIRSLAVEGNFTYGSGGTTFDAWLQTTLDGGANWTDIANFHFLVASGRKMFNLSASTPITTQGTPGDGALAANTAVDGMLGSRFRVKYTSTGTYAATTFLLSVVATGARLMV